ncbi:hypothetical protein EVAR_55064_1 [Eumeta japonica]|uniref:Uncharacterized protein n=1 Tax=Eumeta variegata TaxID=151549 RepID=A0A4C1Z463_EUMVA|nr:hypothetical protein EVAR_55064_1 [Eumeta japonica]
MEPSLRRRERPRKPTGAERTPLTHKLAYNHSGHITGSHTLRFRKILLMYVNLLPFKSFDDFCLLSIVRTARARGGCADDALPSFSITEREKFNMHVKKNEKEPPLRDWLPSTRIGCDCSILKRGSPGGRFPHKTPSEISVLRPYTRGRSDNRQMSRDPHQHREGLSAVWPTIDFKLFELPSLARLGLHTSDMKMMKKYGQHDNVAVSPGPDTRRQVRARRPELKYNTGLNGSAFGQRSSRWNLNQYLIIASNVIVGFPTPHRSGRAFARRLVSAADLVRPAAVLGTGQLGSDALTILYVE